MGVVMAIYTRIYGGSSGYKYAIYASSKLGLLEWLLEIRLSWGANRFPYLTPPHAIPKYNYYEPIADVIGCP